ncbi:MAG: shikimate kinase [Candidatus Dormibacteria bacterium]|jgi:shikimate kinase
MTRPIVLLGLMGSGKTTVGRALARQLGRTLWDSDAVLEELTGRTAAQLADERGIEVLHQLEVEVLSRGVSEKPAAVVAAAAAVVLDPRLPTLLGPAWVVWLRADITGLAARLRTHGGDHGHRPLLAGDTLGTLREMARVRDPLFAQVAHLTVDAGRLAPPVLVRRIVAAMPPGV